MLIREPFSSMALMKNARAIVVFAFALGLLVLILWFVRHALMLIYISIVFAIVLSPAVDRIHRISIRRWHPGRGAALLIIIFATVLAITLFLVLTLPPVFNDLQQLLSNLPQKLQQLRSRMQDIPALQHLDFGALGNQVGAVLSQITGVVGNIASVIISVVTVIILASYLILEGGTVFDTAMSFFPAAAEPKLRKTLLVAVQRMRGWLVGQAILMLILGSASALVFGLLGVRYFYLLAVFAGLSNIIPMLGPILTVVLAGLVAALDSVGKLIGVVVFYFVYQQVENAILTPRIMKAHAKISSTAVLAGLLIGGELAGIPGALVAVPSTVLVTTLLQEYGQHR